MTKRKQKPSAKAKARPYALREDSPPYRVNGNGASHKLRFIDLFCGIGGFRFAMNAACKTRGLQNECVFSSDIDEPAQTAYAANFGERPTGDITKISNSEIPDHDILAGGFPY